MRNKEGDYHVKNAKKSQKFTAAGYECSQKSKKNE